MPAYANVSGKSGVVWYDDRVPDELTVVFRSGRHRTYVYTAASCGTAAMAILISRARAGVGLNSFISQHIRKGYSLRY